MGKYSRLGHDLYTGRRSYDFVGRKWLWYTVSAVLLAIAISGLLVRGLNLGIEFTGGAQYTVSLPAADATQDTADDLREAVAGTGIPEASSPIVTTSGDQAVQVQTETLTDEESAEVVQVILDTTGTNPADISQEEIGPSWGAEIAERALLGIGVFLVLVALMIWAYFREWKMSVAALVALIHDVVITIGIYAIVGFEVTPASVTGLLTILGFSLYDTVVVFDKVRENTRNLPALKMSYSQGANLAVNQTVVRSVNTSIVALLPVGAILYIGAVQLGAGALKDLSLSLFIGMAVGAYSSIFIATPLAVQLKRNEPDIVQAEQRAKARARAADPYATVPTYVEDMPVADAPEGDDLGEPAVGGQEAAGAPAAPRTAPPRRPEAAGKGRTVPPSRGPVSEGGTSGRPQPTRRPRSKRDT
ncbi:Protein translocase subunit SecF [Nocardioides aquaticus]|uniref:Protein-export membrane protein SecF n=1 Tax=Nocardioides aquaticus TaxID=160826 RepID=A0ABX8ELA1_9ACTN|nr:protein translocase subunit SecF [Nocardioides aquaticus]QVT80386.1 Protein translocase subunit SecF [Nocardioides aquaticus]